MTVILFTLSFTSSSSCTDHLSSRALNLFDGLKTILSLAGTTVDSDLNLFGFTINCFLRYILNCQNQFIQAFQSRMVVLIIALATIATKCLIDSLLSFLRIWSLSSSLTMLLIRFFWFSIGIFGINITRLYFTIDISSILKSVIIFWIIRKYLR